MKRPFLSRVPMPNPFPPPGPCLVEIPEKSPWRTQRNFLIFFLFSLSMMCHFFRVRRLYLQTTNLMLKQRVMPVFSATLAGVTPIVQTRQSRGESPDLIQPGPASSFKRHLSEPRALARPYSDLPGLTSRIMAGGHARTERLTGPQQRVELSGGVLRKRVGSCPALPVRHRRDDNPPAQFSFLQNGSKKNARLPLGMPVGGDQKRVLGWARDENAQRVSQESALFGQMIIEVPCVHATQSLREERPIDATGSFFHGFPCSLSNKSFGGRGVCRSVAPSLSSRLSLSARLSSAVDKRQSPGAGKCGVETRPPWISTVPSQIKSPVKSSLCGEPSKDRQRGEVSAPAYKLSTRALIREDKLDRPSGRIALPGRKSGARSGGHLLPQGPEQTLRHFPQATA